MIFIIMDFGDFTKIMLRFIQLCEIWCKVTIFCWNRKTWNRLAKYYFEVLKRWNIV